MEKGGLINGNGKVFYANETSLISKIGKWETFSWGHPFVIAYRCPNCKKIELYSE